MHISDTLRRQSGNSGYLRGHESKLATAMLHQQSLRSGEIRTPAPRRPSSRRLPAPWNLYYHKDSYGNFGDDLNPWLFARLLPDLIRPDSPSSLVGIGTILNSTLPAGPKLIVGSGVGYGAAPVMDDFMQVHFVRGPGTAAALGVPPSMAITDPAYLATQFLPPRGNGSGGTILLPHHVSARNADWRHVARRAGIGYVDPTASALQVIDSIRNARLVITSAMHGAILADAFRVPWVRVAEYRHLNEFKWKDWGDSVGVSSTSRALPTLHDDSADAMWPSMMRRIRVWRRHGRPYRDVSVTSGTMRSSAVAVDEAVSTLRQLNDVSCGTLSSNAMMRGRMEQLRDAFDRLSPASRSWPQLKLVA